ncbi:hypothetical protein LAW66_22695, partial [Escherichia coli]|nr:hypothetical protein [Escherichia coli]
FIFIIAEFSNFEYKLNNKKHKVFYCSVVNRMIEIHSLQRLFFMLINTSFCSKHFKLSKKA